MLEKLAGMGIGKSDILHVAESLFHDHKPANEFGLASCWINRRHDRKGFGATMNPGATPADRLPLQQHGGAGGSPSQFVALTVF